MSREPYTLSALLSKLADVERECANFYRETESHGNIELEKSFSMFLKEHEEVGEKIEMVKREGLIEFTLEPIPDLRINEQLKKVKDLVQGKSTHTTQKAITIEKEISKLMEEISNKIGHMSADANQVLSIAQKRASRRIKVLEQYIKEN